MKFKGWGVSFSPGVRRLQGILDKFSKFIDFHVVITEKQNNRKMIMLENILQYIYFSFSNFQNVVPLFCCHFRGRLTLTSLPVAPPYCGKLVNL